MIRVAYMSSEAKVKLTSSKSQTLLFGSKGLYQLGAYSVFNELQQSCGDSPRGIAEYFASLNKHSYTTSNPHEFNHIGSYRRCGITQIAFHDNCSFFVAKGEVYGWGKQFTRSSDDESHAKDVSREAHLLNDQMFLSCSNYQKVSHFSLNIDCN